MRIRNKIVKYTAFAVALLAVWLIWRLSPENRYNRQIRAAAARYHVDPTLVKAVVWRESRFRPGARGTKGEIGLMQVQEWAAQEWAEAEHITGFQHECCLDPETNTLAGTYYLSQLLKRYARTDNPVPYALAAYNAGRGNVLKWNSGAAATQSAAFIDQIGFPSTKQYVKAILRRQRLYRFLAGLNLG